MAKLWAAKPVVTMDNDQLMLVKTRAARGYFRTIRYSTPRRPAVAPSLILAPFAPKRPSDPASIGFISRMPYELAASNAWLANTGARLSFHRLIAVWPAARRAADSTVRG